MTTIYEQAHHRLVQLLREARLKAGLTQVEVAQRLRRPQSYVSSCESGQRRMDMIEIFKYSEIYKVPMTYFLSAFKRD